MPSSASGLLSGRNFTFSAFRVHPRVSRRTTPPPLPRRGKTDSRFTVRKTVLPSLQQTPTSAILRGTPFIDYLWSRVPSQASPLLEVLVEPLQVMAPPMYSLSAILRLPSTSTRTCDGTVGLGSSLDCLLPQPVTRLSAHPFPCVTLSVKRRSI